MAAPDSGDGTTVVFGTQGFSANLLNVGPPNQTVEDLETSHMGTTGHKTYIPADLIEGGEMSMLIQFAGSLAPTIGAAPELITVDYGGVGAGDKHTFQGYINSYAPESVEVGAIMKAAIGVKVADDLSMAQ